MPHGDSSEGEFCTPRFPAAVEAAANVLFHLLDKALRWIELDKFVQVNHRCTNFKRR